MPHCAEHGDVSQLLAGLDAAEHEPSSAHVSSTDKFGGEQQLRVEDLEQRIHVFRRSNAAEKHDLAIRANRFSEEPRVAGQWLDVLRICRVQVGTRNFP